MIGKMSRIGVAVKTWKEPWDVFRSIEQVLDLKPSKKVETLMVKVAFIHADEREIELLEPIDSTVLSTVMCPFL
jgi:hypothetical protein